MSTVTVSTIPTFVSAIGSGVTVKNTGHEAVTLGGTKHVVFGEGQELAPGAHTTISPPSLSPDVWAVTGTGTTTLTVS